ncbi:hypothetical protein VTK26DRAFT_7187 [Humicola hyalothermophila]
MHGSSQVLLLLGAAANAFSEPLRWRRQMPWPDPVPAASVGPLDWSSIRTPPYSPPSSRSRNGKVNTSASNTKVADTYGAAAESRPSVVDWRNRSGINYITMAQDQGVCQSCWAFGVTAVIESMVRIEHGIWSKRSEADLHGGIGALCESTGNAEDTLAFVAGKGVHFVNETDVDPPGIADWPCDPYEATQQPYVHCADRSGRATHIPGHTALGSVDDQKRWLDQYGPLVATFVLYDDFKAWKPAAPDSVYSYDGVSGSTGNHLALIVGYDDEKQAWIMKNSWGPGWGADGFVYFAYNNANIDSWTKYGVSNVNPDPWSRRRHQSGNMMQSGNGEIHRNFELLLSDPASGLTHISRDGNSTKWSIAATVDSENPNLAGQPSIIGTSFNRDFHAVGVDTNNNLRQWVYSQSEKKWSQVSTIEGHDIDGFPGLVQSDGSHLIMVVKHSDGTLNEWYQQPNSTSWTLSPSSPIAADIAQSGPSLVQSNVNLDLYDGAGASRGNLYAVAVRADGRLQLFWRAGQDAAAASWSAGEVFGSGVAGGTPVVMIQDFFETANERSVGGFQVAVAVNGSVQHWERRNDDLAAGAEPVGDGSAGRRWELVETVGTGVKHVWGLVQGSFGQRLHMITEGVDGGFEYWEWDGGWEVVERLPALGDPAWERSEPVSGG